MKNSTRRFDTRTLGLGGAVLTGLLLAACSPVAVPGSEAGFQAAAFQMGVTGLSLATRDDGGLSVSGKLNGNTFAVRLPANWNGKSVLEAHGYVNPGTAEAEPSPTGAATNPLGDPSPYFGLLSTAYAQGYAVANTAYAKTGYAVRESVEANKALHDFMARAGSKQQYMTGISMGGNITVALAEKYPNDFVGAMPYCGVVAGWRAEQRFLLDFRLVYDYFTKGTAYVLPGNGDAGTPNPALTVPLITQKVAALFTAAGGGDAQARGIIGGIVAVTGTPDAPVSLKGFITPLASAAYGLDDYVKTTGGLGYSNAGKKYAGTGNDAIDADLNAKIQRLVLPAGDTSATYLNANYTPTGRFSAKMLSFHNTSDPLVPYSFEPEFRATVAAAGNSANLVQQTVKPGAFDPKDVYGPDHCYFSQKEVVGAWNDLRNWVEKGVKPEDGKDITNKS